MEDSGLLRQQKIELSPCSEIEPHIKHWLKQRQALLVIFSQLCESNRAKSDKLHTFCQSLVDYLSTGHFQMFEKLAQAQAAYLPHSKGLDGNILDSISQTTDFALDFNDKYTDPKSLTDLSRDLSLLGENLANRMDWEDNLIKNYWNISSQVH